MEQINTRKVLGTGSGMRPFAERRHPTAGAGAVGWGCLRNSCPGIFQCAGVGEEEDAQFQVPALTAAFHNGRGE